MPGRKTIARRFPRKGFAPLVIAAGLFHDFSTAGEVFICRRATAPFEVQFDDGEFMPCEAGTKLTVEPFRRCRVQNLSEVLPLSLVVVIGHAGLVYDFEPNRDRKTRPSNGIIPIGQALNLPGIAPDSADYSDWGIPAGAIREYIVVTNPDNQGVLKVGRNKEDGTDFTIMGTVFGEQSRVFQSAGDTIKIYNASAAPRDYEAEEVFRLG
jgi:hypothetical protein